MDFFVRRIVVAAYLSVSACLRQGGAFGGKELTFLPDQLSGVINIRGHRGAAMATKKRSVRSVDVGAVAHGTRTCR